MLKPGVALLPRRFDEAGLVQDREASLRITRWAYGQVARAGGQVWVEKDVLVPTRLRDEGRTSRIR